MLQTWLFPQSNRTKLRRHHSSIDREIRRNIPNNSYIGETAQSFYKIWRTLSNPKGKCTDNLVNLIAQKLQGTWSPEQIANTVTVGDISFKTIYNWLYSGMLSSINIQKLLQKGKRRKAEKRGGFFHGNAYFPTSQGCQKLRYIWTLELDSIIYSGGESKGCFTTFVDEKVDYISHSRWAQTDRGKEFVCHIAIKEQLGLTLYFVNAYSSWQQGSNENTNVLLGEFYFKKTNLAMVH